MPRCGTRRPPQATRARRPRKFGSGSVGSEMQPKARFPRSPAQINTHKHAHRHRRGRHSQPQVPAYAWQSQEQPLTLVARRVDGSAPRYRARSNGATADLGLQPPPPERGGRSCFDLRPSHWTFRCSRGLPPGRS
ncbi:hypothetical protein HispidOSU_019324 [Sigmodon hispidus]